MSRKGFTLVELLGVLVLLSVIVLIAFPNILGAIKKTDEQVSNAAKTLLETNARSYVNDNISIDKITAKNHCVTVKTLIDEGYTKTPIANVSKDKTQEVENTWTVSFYCENGNCKDFNASSGACTNAG